MEAGAELGKVNN